MRGRLDWIIDEGIKPGERVVVEGILRVKAGMTVNPKPFKEWPKRNRTLGKAWTDIIAMAKFFINRPIVAIVISIVMVIIGVVAMVQLPISQFPNLAPPEVQLNAQYIGADAVTVEQSVATPIEQQMQRRRQHDLHELSELRERTDAAERDFDVGTDPNTDQVLVQMRYAQAESQLPVDVRNIGVNIRKSTGSPLALFSLYSPKETYDALSSATMPISISTIP